MCNIRHLKVTSIALISWVGIAIFNSALGGSRRTWEEILGRRVRQRSYNRFYRQGPRIPLVWRNVGLGILGIVAVGTAAYIIF